jgi:hypothetical protein
MLVAKTQCQNGSNELVASTSSSSTNGHSNGIHKNGVGHKQVNGAAHSLTENGEPATKNGHHHNGIRNRNGHVPAAELPKVANEENGAIKKESHLPKGKAAFPSAQNRKNA